MARLLALSMLCAAFVLSGGVAFAIVPPPDADPPPTNPNEIEEPAGQPRITVNAGTIGELLQMPDSEESETITLTGKIVTAGTEDMVMRDDFDPLAPIPYYFYIEETDRSAGIMVKRPGTMSVPRGSVVTVEGALDKYEQDGVPIERCIIATSVSIAGTASVPGPLAMDNLALGGMSPHANTPGIVLQTPGPYNVGTLVMTWGRVVYLNNSTTKDYILISDGHHICSGEPIGNNWIYGVRVSLRGVSEETINVGDFVVVTGISGVYYADSASRRIVRTRGAADLQKIVTGDSINSPVTTLWPEDAPDDELWSLIGLPAPAVDPEATGVFDYSIDNDYFPDKTESGQDSLLAYNLYRYNVYEQTLYEPYVDPPEIDGFVNVFSGDAYWPWTHEPSWYDDSNPNNDAAYGVSYTGVLSPVTDADRYIILTHANPLWNLIGHPGVHCIPLDNLRVADGLRTLSMRDACSSTENWLSSTGWWYDNAMQSFRTLGFPEGFPASEWMHPWTGYHIGAYRQPLALVFPSLTKCTLTLTATPMTVPPSGDSVLTAQVKSASGYALVAMPVDLTTTQGTLSTTDPESGKTDSNGEIEVTLSDVPDGEVAVVTATLADGCSAVLATQCVQVDFLKGTDEDGYGDDWPMFMHDIRHQGLSRFNDTSTEDPDLSTAAWVGYVSTAGTGRGQWLYHPDGGLSTYLFPHPYIDSSPVHAKGCPVIVGAWADGEYGSSTTGYVVAFDADDGSQSWRYPASTSEFIGGVASTPCIVEVMVEGIPQKRAFVGSMDGYVYCLNALTGELIWRYQTANRGEESAKVLASPTAYGERVYIGNESARAYCLDAAADSANEALVWSYDLPVDEEWPDRTGLSSPAMGVVEGTARLYLGSDLGHLYCLSTADNPAQRVLWDYPGAEETGLGCIESSPMTYAGKVYFCTSAPVGSDTLLALDATDGSMKWSQRLSAEARGTACGLAGHLLIGNDCGTYFYRIDANSGDFDPATTPPNPFDASHPQNLPDPYGSPAYFVGSTACSNAGFCLIGNDNYALYPLSSSDVTLAALTGTSGVVCSTPAISYAVEEGYRYVYVTSRANGGRLLAFRQELD